MLHRRENELSELISKWDRYQTLKLRREKLGESTSEEIESKKYERENLLNERARCKMLYDQMKYIYPCPQCDTQLTWSEDGPVSVECHETRSSSRKELRQTIRLQTETLETLNQWIQLESTSEHDRITLDRELETFQSNMIESSRDVFVQELECIRQQRVQMEKLEAEYYVYMKTLESEQENEKQRQVQLDSIQNELQSLPKPKSLMNMNDLRYMNDIRIEMNTLQTQEISIKTQIRSIENDTEKREQDISKMNEWILERDCLESDLANDLRFSVETQRNSVESLRQRINEIRRLLEWCIAYGHWYNHYTMVTELHDQQQGYMESIETVLADEAATCRLRQLVAEAQGNALQRVINTINTHVQIYLAGFFPEDPISVNISAFKETKTQRKTSITLEIIHRGVPIDMTSLSGGERDRVVLAYALVMAELEDAPFILLDECVSSLDQQHTHQVFEVIQEQWRDKLTVFVAHQIIEGIFDMTIHL